MSTPLSIVLVPGYTWTTGETVTEDKLNLAANPIASLYGTISSTTIADGSITAAKLDAAVAGNGLSGGAGAALSVNVDNSTIEINADTLRVKDAGITLAKITGTAKATPVGADKIPLADSAASDAMKYATVTQLTAAVNTVNGSSTLFTGANTVIPAAGAAASAQAHGLSGTPSFVRVVLVCVTNDAATGWLTTDGDIDLSAGVGAGSIGEPLFLVRADATNVNVLRNFTAGFKLLKKTTGDPTSPTAEANFKFKIYARL